MSWGRQMSISQMIAGWTLVTSVLVGSSAAAQSVEFSCPAPGTSLVISTGQTIVFAPSAGFDCLYGSQSGQHAVFSSIKSYSEIKGVAEKLWPLKIGNSAEAETMAEDSHRYIGTYSCVVEAHEDLVVRAGNFPAFKIVCKLIYPAFKYEDRRIYWWSADLKYIVKFDFALIEGVGAGARAPASWELVSILR
jgi:hypothetical protein